MSITPCEYTMMIDKLRAFFQSQGYMEVHVQGRLSILSACEDPSTLSVFSYGGMVWPLPQTGQFWLETELLRNPLGPRGYFCISTSYRNEHSPEFGRHDGIFPMVEYDMRGGRAALVELQKQLLDDFGFGNFYSGSAYPTGEHVAASCCISEQEDTLRKEHGPVFFLSNNTTNPAPFWDTKKSDVILHGMETIGGAERSCSAHDMRRSFYSIDNGRYAKTLFSHFTRKRVERELDEYLSRTMVERCGGGIGLFRLLRALKLSGLECRVPYPVPCLHEGDGESDDEHPRVCDVKSIFEKVVIDRVNSNTDLRKLSAVAGSPVSSGRGQKKE